MTDGSTLQEFAVGALNPGTELIIPQDLRMSGDNKLYRSRTVAAVLHALAESNKLKRRIASERDGSSFYTTANTRIDYHCGSPLCLYWPFPCTLLQIASKLVS